MAAYIVGVVLVLGAVGLFFGARGQKKKLSQIKGTETSTAEELKSLSESVAKEIGAGSFNQITEAKGTVECAEPVVSELSQTPCVYYTMSVTREYEETYWDKDQQGNRVQRTRRGSENVAGNTRSIPFLLRDATGAIAVDPAGASFVAEKVFSRFDQGEARDGTTYGRFSFSLKSLALGSGRRTIGFRYEESAIPVGRQLYVLGEAVDSGGRLHIKKPAVKDARFIVSLKSEEELVSGAQSTSTALTVIAAIAAVAGLVVSALAFLHVI